MSGGDRQARLRLVPGLGGALQDDELGHRVVVQWGPVDPELVHARCRCGQRAAGNAVPPFIRVHSVRASGEGERHPSVSF